MECSQGIGSNPAQPEQEAWVFPLMLQTSTDKTEFGFLLNSLAIKQERRKQELFDSLS